MATFVNRFVGVRDFVAAAPATWVRTNSPRLRPLANEDVYLFVKRIDNGNVVRAADPIARRVRSRTAATGFIAAMLVIAGLVPAAYNTMAGFTLQNLRSEQSRLKQQQARLDLAEAKLLNYDRLERLATTLKMVDPSPQQVQFLDGRSSEFEGRASEGKPRAEARNILPFPSADASAR